jgi:predicted alpha/beta superfamily hydrolase
MNRLILLVLFFIEIIYSQINVSFIVSVKKLPDSSSVYIVGNHLLLGNWNPSFIPLEKKDSLSWSRSFNFSEGTNLEFKITRGSWESEAIYEKGKIPSNFVLNVSKDTVIQINVNEWRDEEPNIPNFKGKITGEVDYYKNVEFPGILPRDVIVWLPPDYDENPLKKFQVLYMHDGQNIFDPKTSFTKVDWQIDETADSMIKADIIQSLIIVGIYNTQDRREEYSPGLKGNNYMKFVVEKLKPMIDNKYRTLPQREHTSTGGSSMGGLISFMLLWEYNKIFSKAICMSPAYIYRDYDYVKTLKSYSGERKDLKVYFDNGDDELDSQLQFGVDSMLKFLIDKNYKQNIDFIFFKDLNAKHTETAWANRFWKPLLFLFKK